VVAFEAGRDGFWLARWLRERGIKSYVIHPTGIAVSREHRRAKATMIRLGIRGFNVKLRKPQTSCRGLRTAEGVPLPPNTLDELRRDMVRLQLIREPIKAIEQARVMRLRTAPQAGTHPMVLMLAKVLGVALETAVTLVHEVLSRNLRDEKAVGRYGGLTGAPDESGSKRRERAWLARATRGCAEP
jgi:transposase